MNYFKCLLKLPKWVRGLCYRVIELFLSKLVPGGGFVRPPDLSTAQIGKHILMAQFFLSSLLIYLSQSFFSKPGKHILNLVFRKAQTSLLADVSSN